MSAARPVREQGTVPSRAAEPSSLWIHASVVSRLLRLAARPWEVGGWLLGYWTADERSVFVTHATPPARRGTPFGVWISGKGHRERFDRAWAASGGHVTFLGDWHTHPGCAATPSPRDLVALRQLAHEPDFGTPRPLAAIVRTGRWPFRAAQHEVRWHVLSGDKTVYELSPRITDELPEPARAVPGWRWPPGDRRCRRRY